MMKVNPVIGNWPLIDHSVLIDCTVFPCSTNTSVGNLCFYWTELNCVGAMIDGTLHAVTALLDSAAVPSGWTSSACRDPGLFQSEPMDELNDMAARHMSIKER